MTATLPRENAQIVPLTSSVAAFAANPPNWQSIPSALKDMALNAFIDTTAVMIAGFDEPSVTILRRHVAETLCSRSEASIVFGIGGRVSVQAAALVNGVAAHVLDYDDIAFRAHPSAVLIPALLAEGERLGSSGEALLTAYLVGYEVWADLAAREADSYHAKGWHPSSALGSVAATAALAVLSPRTPRVICNALGTAAAYAGGLTGNFGSMSKHLQIGRAAAAAVEALQLADLGFTGANDILEHHGGLLSALSPAGKVDLTSRGFYSDEWKALRTPLDFKKYPVCYAGHRVIDGIFHLITEHGIKHDDVSAVTVRLRPPQVSILRSHQPRNALDARFSIEFAIAAPLVSRQLGLRELSDDFVNDPRIQALLPRITIDVPAEGTEGYGTERLWITLNNGSVIDSEDLPKASSNDDLSKKFFDCCATRTGVDAEALYQSILALPMLSDIREITRLPSA
jgi:2-methylcitrate dehydratase PrpD